MKFIQWLYRQCYGNDHDSLLDHVPVQKPERAEPAPIPEPFHGTTLEEAITRHGKKFRAAILYERQEPKSRFLEELEAQAQKPKPFAWVEQLKKVRK